MVVVTSSLSSCISLCSNNTLCPLKSCISLCWVGWMSFLRLTSGHRSGRFESVGSMKMAPSMATLASRMHILCDKHGRRMACKAAMKSSMMAPASKPRPRPLRVKKKNASRYFSCQPNSHVLRATCWLHHAPPLEALTHL
jgi:hypothetical protein